MYANLIIIPLLAKRRNKMRTIKWIVTIIGTGMLFWFMVACENNSEPPTIMDNTEIKTFPDMADTEQTLADLAAVLPEALTDPELAKIVWNEAKANEEDETYALWSNIADTPTESGVTLRNKIQRIVRNRAVGRTSADTDLLLSAFDEIDYLQFYIHAFEEWDGVSMIQSTYTPLTIDDVDITEINLYDSFGNITTIEMDTTSPDYPIIVVGINEFLNLSSNKGKLASSTDTEFKLYKLKIKKHPNNYEPWINGTNAEFGVYTLDENGYFNWVRSSYRSYKVWNLKWRGWTSKYNYWKTLNWNLPALDWGDGSICSGSFYPAYPDNELAHRFILVELDGTCNNSDHYQAYEVWCNGISLCGAVESNDDYMGEFIIDSNYPNYGTTYNIVKNGSTWAQIIFSAN